MKNELLNVSRAGRANTDDYKAFLFDFVPCIIGAKVFKGKCRTKKLSTYFTVSDEGFLKVVIENYIHSWYDKMTDKNESEERAVSDCDVICCWLSDYFLPQGQLPPYTTEKKKDGSVKVLKKWSQDGINRFNSICHNIIKDRNFKSTSTFDESFRLYCESKWLGKQSMDVSENDIDEKNRKRKAYNDLDGEDVGEVVPL